MTPPLAVESLIEAPVSLKPNDDANASSQAKSCAANEVPTDSFATGVTSLISLSAIQKVVGLLRTVLFCWLLTDDQLGRWSLVLAFLVTAAPVAVLGLPGTFGKYVEYFRQRGQLRAFLRRTTAACMALALVPFVWMLIDTARFSHWIFRSQDQVSLMVPIAIVLLLTIVWNYLNELLLSLRMIRVVTALQFINATSFTLFGAALVLLDRQHERAIIVAYGIANLLPVLGALWVLTPIWRSLSGADGALNNKDVWSKLIPFAGWVWLSNLLANTFNASSQYMIKLFADQDPKIVDSLVGQFYASRVVPMIMVSVAVYFSSVVLPYLSHDWELGRRDEVSRRLNTTLKMLALAFSVGGAFVMLGAPLLFTYGLGGRYDSGLSLMSWTLTYCAWYSLISVAQNYLWCAEKAWLGSCALVVALATNVALNYLLFPVYGLNGVVWATTASTAVALVGEYTFAWLNGFRIDRSVWIATLVPTVIGIGGTWGAVVILLGAIAALRGNWILNDDEKQTLLDTATSARNKARRVLTAGLAVAGYR